MSGSNHYVLAIDLGTSGPKAAVISQAGDIVATSRAVVEQILLPDEGAEQDPEAVWAACKQVCREVLQDSGVDPKRVLALACSSQYSSVVPVDEQGNATMNMVLWMDKRGDKRRLQQLDNYPSRSDSWFQFLQRLRIHGLPPIGGSDSLSHIRWIRHARPDVYERTHKFLEPMDYLIHKFTGEFTANQCTALMSLCTDNRQLNTTRYSETLLSYSGIDSEKLPDLVPLDAIVGTVLPAVAAEIGLAPETKVTTGLNDTQSGGMGTYAFTGDHGAISIGSTGVLITHVNFKRTDVRHAIMSMPSPVADTYFVTAENGIAGGALSHFLENIIYADDSLGHLSTKDRFTALSQAIADVPPGCDGVLFLPWMAGSFAPSADARMRGGFLNLGLDTSRSHLARSVMEGVAMNLSWLRDSVEGFTGRQFSHHLFYGGGAESGDWSQIMADVLDSPIHRLENPQYVTCLGAGLLAFERLGMVELDDFAKLVRVKQVYEPRAEYRALYDALLGQFKAAFRRTKPIIHELNRPGFGTARP